METAYLIYTLDAASDLLGYKKVGSLRQAIKRLKTRGEDLIVGQLRFVLVSKNCYIGVEKDVPFEVIGQVEEVPGSPARPPGVAKEQP